MKNHAQFAFVTVTLCGLSLSNPSFAQDTAKQEDKPDSTATMASMMQLAKPGENHKLLEGLAGTWSYKVKWWTSPDAPPAESSGTTRSKLAMDGRYLLSEHSGKMSMPGPDGKMMDMNFKGMGTDGYDNVKKKFVSSWIDNMGTSIIMMEGKYDPAANTITYTGEEEMTPGTKTKVRQVLKITDHDHHVIEFYEDHGTGTETKTMEIVSTRSKAVALPIGYFEVAGPDSSKLADFYRQVFGWEIKPGPFPGYFNITGAESSSPRGGIRQDPAERVLYVRVPNLQATLDEAVKHGARIVIPPTDVKGVVNFAIFEDPEGNRMGIIL